MQIVHPFALEQTGEHIPCSWTPEHVEKRLVDALKVSRRLPGGLGGPSQITTAWPVFRDEWSYLVSQLGSPDDPDVRHSMKHTRERPKQPTALEISLHDEAMFWIGHYVGDRRANSERRRKNTAATDTIPSMAAIVRAAE